MFKRDKEGLHGKFKIIGQVGLGIIVGLTLYLSDDAVIRENIEVQRGANAATEIVHKSEAQKSTKTTIPFFKNNNLDYANAFSWLGEYKQLGGWILFVFMTILVVTAVSNSANLNDGMDGMAAGNSSIMGIAIGILAYVSSNVNYAGYLNIMYIPGAGELVIFAAAKPDPNFNLLDRFLCMMEYQHVPVTICFNKCDLITEEQKKELEAIYKPAGYVSVTLVKTGFAGFLS